VAGLKLVFKVVFNLLMSIFFICFLVNWLEGFCSLKIFPRFVLNSSSADSLAATKLFFCSSVRAFCRSADLKNFLTFPSFSEGIVGSV